MRPSAGRLRPLVILPAILAIQVAPASAQSRLERGLEPLQSLAGNWSVVGYSYSDQGWVEGDSTRGEFRPVLGGSGFSESTLVRAGGQDIDLFTIWSYDQIRDVYRLAVLDREWGILDIYEGTVADGELRVTNERSRTWFTLQDGSSMKFRLTYRLRDEDSFGLLIESAVDGVDTWEPFLKVEYSRLGE